MNANLYGMFLARQVGMEDKPCLIWREEAVLYFGELVERVGRYRAVLQSLGVASGDRVVMQVARTPDFVLLYLACLASGAVVVPLRLGCTPEELAYVLAHARPALLVGVATCQDMLEAAAREARVRLETLRVDGPGTLTRLAIEAVPHPGIAHREPDDVAALLYIGGDAGQPRRTSLTHGDLSCKVEALHQTWRFSPEDVVLHALPLFHAHGLFEALNLALWSGNTTILPEPLDAAAVAGHLPQASVLIGAPAFYADLRASPGFTKEAGRNIRLFLSSPIAGEMREGAGLTAVQEEFRV